MAKQNITKRNEANHEFIPKKDFNDFCGFIEKTFFGYSSIEHLDSASVLKLKGLLHGQKMAKNNQEEFNEYPFEVLKIAFQMYQREVLNAMRGKEFKTAFQRMSFICAIIENKLPDTYHRFLNAQNSEERLSRVDVDAITHTGAGYQKSKERSKEREESYERFW